MLSIKGGIRPDEHKYTKNSFITSIPSPDTVKIFTYSDDVTVSAGDRVLVGTPLTVRHRAHSSVSGYVEAVEDGYVTVKNDTCNEVDQRCIPFSIRLADAKFSHIIKYAETKAIRFNGEFLDDRLKLAKENKSKVLIINCGETAPFECSSYRVFAEYLNEILFGAKTIMKALGISKAAVALENHRRDHVKALKTILNKQKFFKILSISPKYPASDPTVLRKSFYDKFGRSSGYKLEEIFVVSAIEAYELFKSFRTGLPQLNTLVTVDGTAVHEPKVLRAPIGCTIDYILGQCDAEGVNTVLEGNPLKGSERTPADVLMRDTVSLLAFAEPFTFSEPTECIGCGRCSKVCPLGLDPVKLYNNKMYTSDCIACGACTYVCPAKYDFSEIYGEKEVSCEL